MANMNRYYKILELEPGASLEEVKQAYRDLAFVWHPDRYSHNLRLQQRAQQKLQEINEAYKQLHSFLDTPKSVSSPPRPTPIQTRSAETVCPPTSMGKRPGDRSPISTHRPFKRDSSRLHPTHACAIPWGWLMGTFLSYGLTGATLTLSQAPLWIWALTLSAAWCGAAILTIDRSASPKAWFVTLGLAGVVGGSIAGTEAGGLVTGITWAIVGAGLGAIAGSSATSTSVTMVVSLAGVATLGGLVAGTGSGNWTGAVVGASIGANAGFLGGAIAELCVNRKRSTGVGRLTGLGMGAWFGAAIGVGPQAIAVALSRAGTNGVIGAWGAIAIVAGVVAQMVAGERLTIVGSRLGTFIILVAISGSGLGCGRELTNWLV